MEKKKLLLVAVSVGVVLLIIIGIPLMMIAPRQSQPLAVQTALSNDVDRGWGVAIEPTAVQSFQPPAPLIEEAPVLQPEETIAVQPAPAVPQVTTITVPVPQTAAVPNTPVAQTQKPATVKLAPTAAAAKPAPAAPKETATVAAKPATVAAAPAAKPAASTPARTYDTYWVQTGAFSTKVRAEGAKESLASKGIASVIDNRDIDGKTWYRVRVGPYMSETEANYWLALVKSIDGFAESQIRLTQATR